MGWWDEWGQDLLSTGLDIADYNDSQDAIEESKNTLNEGFNKQNPWSMYQPSMGINLMNLLSNPETITETPGYQFAYDQGLQALGAKQNASGKRFSGQALTETMQYGQGLASQMWNDEVNRYSMLSGATQGTSGGIATAEGLSSLGQQQSFNQGYFLNNLFNSIGGSRSNTVTTTPTVDTLPPSSSGSEWDGTGNFVGP